MQTDFLEYLLDVRETGSLSKTAANFYISYQSVRSGIKNLESQFGVELLRCDNHGCKLTEAGEKVAEFAEIVFKEQERLKQTLRGYEAKVPENKKDPLTLYIISGGANKAIIDFAIKYKKENRKNQLSVHIVQIEQFNDLDIIMDEKTIILGIFVGESYTVYQEMIERFDLEWILLARVPMYLCVSRESKLAKQSFATNEDLRKITIYQKDYDEYKMKNIANWDFVEKPQIVNGLYEQGELIKNNMGGAIYNEMEYQAVFGKNTKSVVKLPLMRDGSEAQMNYAAFMKKDIEVSPLVNEFLRELCKVFP